TAWTAHINIRREPLGRIAGIDGVVPAVPAVDCEPTGSNSGGGCGRAVVLRSAEQNGPISGMLRKRDEVTQRAQVCIQVVERVRCRASSGAQVVAVKRAVHTTIVAEVHQSVAVHNHEVEIVLVGMKVRNPGDGATAVHASQVEKSGRAGWI